MFLWKRDSRLHEYQFSSGGSTHRSLVMRSSVVLDEFDRLILKFLCKSKRPKIGRIFLMEEKEKKEENEEGNFFYHMGRLLSGCTSGDTDSDAGADKWTNRSKKESQKQDTHLSRNRVYDGSSRTIPEERGWVANT